MNLLQLLQDNLVKNYAQAMMVTRTRKETAVLVSKKFGCTVNAARNAIWYW